MVRRDEAGGLTPTRQNGSMPRPLRVAYTLEQCWHDVPGGTARSALEVARRLLDRDDVELFPVAGRHRNPPDAPYVPPTGTRALPLARPFLYETWNRWSWPKVERSTGEIDVCHSTLAIPAATDAPHVVTVHDIAFVHTPDRFTGHGARVMRTGLERCRAADLLLVPSAATRADLIAEGFDADRVRIVPWGVTGAAAGPGEIERVRRRYDLPERFVLFVGTLEPRKNLERLIAANAVSSARLPLVVAGPAGWGELADPGEAARRIGFVPDADLFGLYSAATVFAYPSLEEGFGLPVAEAMASGTPVVTSRGSATEEVAGGAAVLVDPRDVASIASGIDRAIAESATLIEAGSVRAAELAWDTTVDATVEAYRDAAAIATDRRTA